MLPKVNGTHKHVLMNVSVSLSGAHLMASAQVKQEGALDGRGNPETGGFGFIGFRGGPF